MMRGDSAFEGDMTGAIRIFRQGQLNIMIIKAVGLSEGLDKMGVPADSLAARLTNLFFQKQMGEDVTLPAKLKAAGIVVSVGAIDCTSGANILVLPPGHFALYGVGSNEVVSGIRQSFYPKGRFSMNNYVAATPQSSGRDAVAALG